MNKINKRFVVGDIHGTYKALVQVLERAEFDYDNDMLITIGDIVDGWGDSYNVVEELLKINNRIDIIGNHDTWFTKFIETGVHPDSWTQGGLATAKSYAKGVGIELKVQNIYRGKYETDSYTHNLISTDVPETHQKFFKGQHRYYVDDDKNVFVHGGFDRTKTIGDSSLMMMTWDRTLWNQALSSKSSQTPMKFFDEVKNVFIGHTTTMAWGSIEPMKAGGVWNIDTGAGGDGKLTLMNVDTEEYFQSDLVPELYPDDEHNANLI